MKLIAKVAVLTAAAACLAPSAIVAESAAVAASPMYSCKVNTGTAQSAPFDVPVGLNFPTETVGAPIPKGTTFAGTAGISGINTVVANGDQVATQEVRTMSSAPQLTVSPGSFPVTVARVGLSMPIELSPKTFNRAEVQTVLESGTLPLSGVFDQTLAAPLAPGVYTLNLPNEFSIALANDVTPIGQFDCAAMTPQTTTIVVKDVSRAASLTAALKAAHVKLAKDVKALGAAKKALKKAKGHKRVVLKKKVAKLTKKVRADRAKIASLSKK